MSIEYFNDGRDAFTQIRDLISRLQAPFNDRATLLPCLAAPLDALHLLPPNLRRYNTTPLSPGTFDTYRHLPLLQRALLEHVVPTWISVLIEQNMDALVLQYFCPDSFSFATQSAGDTAICAYTTILSLPLTESSIVQLANLTKSYPVDRLHSAIFSKSSPSRLHRQMVMWEDCVRNIAAIPAKVANHLRGATNIPEGLQHGPYFSNLCVRVELLLSTFAKRGEDKDSIASLTFLIEKMINLGLFSSAESTTVSQPSFFCVNLPMIRTRLSTLHKEEKEKYSWFWTELWTTLSSRHFHAVMDSLFAALTDLSDALDPGMEPRGLIKREANILAQVIGTLTSHVDEKWQVASAVITARTWTEAKARIIVCWVAGCKTNSSDDYALDTLLSHVVDVWASSEHIKHSLLSHHHYLTALLLVSISYIPRDAPPIHALALSSSFITSIGTYIGHLDGSVRRCGMLVAEVVAKYTGKTLDFGGWEGTDEGRPWARKLRVLLANRDIDAQEAANDIVQSEVDSKTQFPGTTTITESKPSETQRLRSVLVENAGYDSDDSLTGYASPRSSRSPSPSLSELEEYAKDPTLHVGKKKVQKPVYLADVGSMLRSNAKPDDPEEADRIEVALSCAEELIRKKKDYGSELEENAVNLVYALVGLQNTFELDGFDEKRQGAVNALVSCCPRKATHAIIAEYFKNQYSTDQRFVMLNGLALGARELASLPVPLSSVPNERTTFPSKRLPRLLHNKYATAYEQVPNPVQGLVDGISQLAIDKGKEAVQDKVPAIVRERQLRIKKPQRVTELNSQNQVTPASSRPQRGTTFTDVAAEHFIAPLVGRFWLFLRDEQSREERSLHRTSSYQGTGTGLILSPLVLAQFLRTVAVLMHAARFSLAYLAVLAPDTLELAVTLGTRPMSTAEEDKEREAAVLTGCLELALIVLDACLDLDGGRSMSLEHTSLLLGAGEWAGQVLGLLDKGARVQGGGGVQEVKLKRAAAGVVIKVDELASRWRQSMITLQ